VRASTAAAKTIAVLPDQPEVPEVFCFLFMLTPVLHILLRCFPFARLLLQAIWGQGKRTMQMKGQEMRF
jgi:hypothetical protein